MAYLYKICPAPLWAEAERAGVFRGSPLDLQDGFIHLSSDSQVVETAAKHFAGQADLLLLTVDGAALGSSLRWEPSRGGALFPHVYGEIPVGAFLSVEPLPLGPGGRHLFPDEIAPGGRPRFAPSAAGWVPVVSDHFIGLVGPLWTKEENGATRYGFLAERRHLNRNGMVHGGMIMSFADQALGLAAWTANGMRPQATAQLDTHFVSGVKEGEFVEAECRVVRKTRWLLFMAGELKVGERMVATANGLWKVREPRPSPAAEPRPA